MPSTGAVAHLVAGLIVIITPTAPPARVPAGKDGGTTFPKEEVAPPNPQHTPEPGSRPRGTKQEAARPRGRPGDTGSTLNPPALLPRP